jgi:hypothetical protein
VSSTFYIDSSSRSWHTVVRVADEPHGWNPGAATLDACPFWSECFPLACEVFVQHGQSDVGQQRREDAANAIANFEFDVSLAYVKGERRGRKVHHSE